MCFYPYAAPISATLTWTGTWMGMFLMAGGLVVAIVPAVLMVRHGRARRKRVAAILMVIPSRQQPRAAA